MDHSFVPVWKEAPFIRLVVPLIIGMVIARYADNTQWVWLFLISLAILLVTGFGFLPLSLRFLLAPAQGVGINVLLLASGGLLLYWNDDTPRAAAIAQVLTPQTIMRVRVIAPSSVRPASYKTLCRILSIGDERRTAIPATNLIAYFDRRSARAAPSAGEEYLIKAIPRRITNQHGDNAFDYVRYCSAKNIFYRVFIRAGGDEQLSSGGSASFVDESFLKLYDLQRWVVRTLREYIGGDKEYGLAAALLVGYKDDLDKELTQAYVSTGVVHVIAISGLHLALIYGLFNLLCKPLQGLKSGRMVSVFITLAALWAFSFLVGGGPSVIRAATMFTTMALGRLAFRKLSVFNNLAASAFFLLCIDPLWLWDIGFQLSYAALLSIVLFMKPIYRLIACTNPLLDAFWKLNAVTLAAQVLTAPICIFYFHQFPFTFLLSNIVAVPLSGVILLGEIAICAASFMTPLATGIGALTEKLLHLMNVWIEMLANVSFSSATGLNISLLQTVILYGIIAALMGWLVFRKPRGAIVAFAQCILFMADRFN